MRVAKIVACCFTVCLASRAAADPVDNLMVPMMARAHIPGAAVAVVRSGRIEKLSGYGLASTEYGAPVTPDTPFQIASSSKIYTAVLLMRLVDQHQLNLDDSVTKYVPDAPSAWRPITIRNLATHTSGLAPIDIKPDITYASNAVRQAFATKINSKPGEKADYEGFDYALLQSILEKVGGKPFAQLLHDEVYAPAGMTCTQFDMARDLGPQRVADTIPGRAEYYRWMGTENQRRWFMYSQYAYAAGGAYSCAKDMARLIIAAGSGTLLPAHLAAKLETPTLLSDGSKAQFGVGWAVGTYRGHRWAGHSGGPAFSDVMYFPDDKIGIIVFANQRNLAPRLASLIADQYIPAPRDYDVPHLNDSEPTLTNSAQQILEGAAKGHVEGGLFAKAARSDYVSDLDDLGPVWVGLFGPISRMVLIDDKVSDTATRSRRYRVFFGKHAAGFSFAFDRQGKVTDVNSDGD
jgi:CubicO group peptidase (beta-lactamase class C family)